MGLSKQTNSKITDRQKGKQLTKVLKQLGLDESTIGCFAEPNFSPGRTSNFEQQLLTSTK
jgi:hypothetical protein